MAGEAFDIFADSYLKGLKRPEFWNFNPDSAFGANMMKGSENQNPWANRDKDNAKYGIFGGTANAAGKPPVITSSAPGMTGASQASPLNPGMLTQPQPSTFAKLMGEGEGQGAKWLGGNIADNIKQLLSTDNPEVKASVGTAMEHMLGGTLPQSAVEKSVAGFGEGIPALTGVESAVGKLGEAAPGGLNLTAPDPTSMGLSLAPTGLEALTGSKTAGNVAGAGINTGLAAAQGGMNPLSDVAALASIYKLMRGFF